MNDGTETEVTAECAAAKEAIRRAHAMTAGRDAQSAPATPRKCMPLLGVVLALAACADAAPEREPGTQPAAATRDGVRSPEAVRRRLETLERVDDAPSDGTAVTGEVPDELLERMRKDATRRFGVDPASLEVMRAESVIWSDGSLGCPLPGVMYTQALVPGFHVILRADVRQVDYRARANGTFEVCEAAVPQKTHDPA